MQVGPQAPRSCRWVLQMRRCLTRSGHATHRMTGGRVLLRAPGALRFGARRRLRLARRRLQQPRQMWAALPPRCCFCGGRTVRCAKSRLLSTTGRLLLPQVPGSWIRHPAAPAAVPGIIFFNSPPLYKLRPCPSYSGCRDRINLVPNVIRYKCSAATKDMGLVTNLPVTWGHGHICCECLPT